MSVTSTSTGTNSATVGGAQAAATPLSKSKSDSDRFMQMLLTQLTHQDPTEPMKSSEMTQQMVGIQQIASMDTLRQQISSMNQGVAATASSILGKTVELTSTDGTDPVSGKVTAVRQSADNGLQVVVGGQAYLMSQISSVTN